MTEINKMEQKSRHHCFTINNYKPDHETEQILKLKGATYYVFGKEVGASGTPHLQGYVHWRTPRAFRAVCNYIKGWHIEPTKGTNTQAIEYAKKDGDWIEWGDPPKQGDRGDLKAIKDSIVEGKKVDEIIMENPIMFHQYGRTLNKIEDLTMRKKFRTEMTQGIWFWGPTGVGKSHNAFKDFTPETHYVLNINDNGWWEGYTQQDTVIINEFRGQIPYGELLDLLDKWPKTVKRRCREPVPFTSKVVIITSSKSPEECYHGIVLNDSLEQLLRRLKVINLTGGNGTEVVGGNTSPDHCELFLGKI